MALRPEVCDIPFGCLKYFLSRALSKAAAASPRSAFLSSSSESLTTPGSLHTRHSSRGVKISLYHPCDPGLSLYRDVEIHSPGLKRLKW